MKPFLHIPKPAGGLHNRVNGLDNSYRHRLALMECNFRWPADCHFKSGVAPQRCKGQPINKYKIAFCTCSRFSASS